MWNEAQPVCSKVGSSGTRGAFDPYGRCCTAPGTFNGRGTCTLNVVHTIVKEEAKREVSTVAYDGRDAEVVRVAENPAELGQFTPLYLFYLVLFETEEAGWLNACVSITRST